MKSKRYAIIGYEGAYRETGAIIVDTEVGSRVQIVCVTPGVEEHGNNVAKYHRNNDRVLAALNHYEKYTKNKKARESRRAKKASN